MTIDQRIKKLEARWVKAGFSTVPGTTISRVLKPDPPEPYPHHVFEEGWEWSLALGGMNQAGKIEFHADTIMGCVRKAEQFRFPKRR